MSDLRRNIEYNVDQSSINKAKQEIDKLRKEEVNLAKAVIDAGDANEAQLKALQKNQKAQRDLASVLRVVDTSFGKQEKAVKEATNALDEYEDRLRSVQRGGADLSGDLASSFGGLRGAGDALSGGNFGAAGKGFEVAEAFADLGEFLPRLGAQAETLGNALRGADGQLGKTVSSITGLSAGTSAFLSVAVPAVVVLGGLAAGYTVLQKAQEKQIEAIKQEADARERAIDFLIQGASSDEVTTRLEEIAQERAILETELVNQSQQNYDEYLTGTRTLTQDVLGLFSETSNKFLGQFNPLSRNLEIASEASQRYGGAVDFAIQQIDGAEQAYFEVSKEHQARLDELAAEEAQLARLRDEGAFSANDMATAEAQLADEREKAMMEAEQAVTRANQLQAQMDQIRIDNDIADRNAAELEAAQAQIDRENAQVAEAKHRETLANIAKAGQERIQQITDELNNLPRERAAKLAEVQQEGNKKIADLQKDYQQRTIEQYEAFQKDMERSTSDAAKAIARLARDIRQSLTDATLENDVAAFLKAQRDGETRLQDAREDASEQQKRAIQDFVEGREKERQAFMEKQAAIQQAIADEQQQVMQAYNERRMALEQQRQAEQQALQERLAQERQRHQEQLANDARRAEQQARLDNIRERQQQEALARQLQEINTKRQAELSALEAVLAKVNQIGTAARNISIPSGGTQSPVFGGRDSGGSKGGGSNIFAKFNNIFNNTIGDLVSSSDVERTMNDNNQKIMGGLNAAVQELRSGRNSYA